MSFNKIIVTLNTVRHLRLMQVCFYIYYFFLKKKGTYTKLSARRQMTSYFLSRIVAPVPLRNSLLKDGAFVFLNRSQKFHNCIDWNFSGWGKLWTYNLNYFDFLFQKEIAVDTGLMLIRDFIANREIKDGLEPYCISVRTVQWIKFLCLHQIADDTINAELRLHTLLLKKRIEYHLSANHVLENAFALTIASVYFQDKKLHAQATVMLLRQIDEQIFDDGGHYERSPMYQLILLNRLLDVINILSHSNWSFVSLHFKKRMNEVASRMLGWISAIQTHGQVPAFQDSVNSPFFALDDIYRYADRLGVSQQVIPLGSSKYRKLSNADYTLIADVGSPSPSHQPGHAHAGALSFVLYYGATPLLVDPGISTYEVSALRLEEKSTRFHNTVEVNGVSQSEVWGSFRMARRANVEIIEGGDDQVIAMHNGYRQFSVLHRREFLKQIDGFVIRDNLTGIVQGMDCIAYLHFHPEREIRTEHEQICVDNGLIITLQGHQQFYLEDYQFANDFNSVSTAKKISIHFQGKLTIHLKLVQCKA